MKQLKMVSVLVTLLLSLPGLAATVCSGAHLNAGQEIQLTKQTFNTVVESMRPRDNLVLSLKFEGTAADFKNLRSQINDLGLANADISFAGHGFIFDVPSTLPGRVLTKVITAVPENYFTKGRAIISLRMTKAEAIKFKENNLIYTAGVTVEPLFKSSVASADGIVRSGRAEEKVINPSSLAAWKSLGERDVVSLSAYGKHSKSSFAVLVQRLERDQTLEVSEVNFNEAQKMGYFKISGSKGDLINTLKLETGIDSVQLN